MVFPKSTKRRLYEMSVGAILTISVLMIAFPPEGFGLLNLFAVTLFATVFSIPLLRRANALNEGTVNTFELFSMMAAGGAFFLFVSTIALTPLAMNNIYDLIGMVGISFVLFFVPATILLLLNKRRETESLNPA